jgi:CII-binding regulator of phage lambda lysogenization HflD
MLTLEVLLQYGSPIATMLIGWLLGLKVQKAQVKANELDNVQQAITIWRGLAEDLEAKLTGSDQKVNELSERLEQMQKQVNAIALKCQLNCFQN